jgi:SAM-dependent methyltransferase
MHYNSLLLFHKYVKPLMFGPIRVLEIGPGGIPSIYQRMVTDPRVVWHTLDLASAPHAEKLTYRAENEYAFPIENDAYDIVLSGQVIEHVRRTWVWIREVARVCRPGGRVITIYPINWPYHEAPVDCWRIYPEGMKTLYEEAGLRVSLGTFEQLDRGGPRYKIHPRVDPLVEEARRLVRRALGRPAWPLGGWQSCYAVDGITIGEK